MQSVDEPPQATGAHASAASIKRTIFMVGG